MSDFMSLLFAQSLGRRILLAVPAWIKLLSWWIFRWSALMAIPT